MLEIEFNSNLADGREIHVVAEVGEGVDLKSVSLGQVGDDVIIPLASLSAADLLGIHDDASEAYYDELRRNKESA